MTLSLYIVRISIELQENLEEFLSESGIRYHRYDINVVDTIMYEIQTSEEIFTLMTLKFPFIGKSRWHR